MNIRALDNLSEPKAAIQQAVSDASAMYHRLVFVVRDTDQKFEDGLRTAVEECGWPWVNLNLELSLLLKDMPVKSRPLKVDSSLRAILSSQDSPVLCLGHTEILFDRGLEQNPALTLRHLSRNKTLIATWNGRVAGRHLIFGPSDHPDHRRVEIEDEIILDTNPNTNIDSTAQPAETQP